MEECSKVSTCFECEQKPGCGWCSSPNINRPARCSTKEQNEATCPPEGREKKYDEEPVVLKNHTDFEKSPRYAQLQPKHVEMRLNVGETKTLPFTYMFISNFQQNKGGESQQKLDSNRLFFIKKN